MLFAGAEGSPARMYKGLGGQCERSIGLWNNFVQSALLDEGDVMMAEKKVELQFCTGANGRCNLKGLRTVLRKDPLEATPKERRRLYDACKSSATAKMCRPSTCPVLAQFDQRGRDVVSDGSLYHSVVHEPNSSPVTVRVVRPYVPADCRRRV